MVKWVVYLHESALGNQMTVTADNMSSTPEGLYFYTGLNLIAFFPSSALIGVMKQ